MNKFASRPRYWGARLTRVDTVQRTSPNLASLKSITLPSLVTTIPDYAFSGCTVLDSLTVMSKKITSLGCSAFIYCTALVSFDFFSELTSIGSYAFFNCTSLESVVFPSSLESIGSSAFYNCTSLESVVFPSSLESIGSSAFYSCTSLTSVAVPNSVISLGTSVFSDCTSLGSATLPQGLKKIPSKTFFNCYRLTDFTFPTNITSIEEGAFRYCYLLKEGASRVDIPSTVTSIGNDNFERVRNVFITSSSIATIGNRTFSSHTKIYVPEGKVEMYKVATNWSSHADCIFTTDSYTGDAAPAGTIDMGMDVFWATCNLGASNPEDYGDYYAWGETEPYYESQNPLVWKEGKSAGYDWPSYKWCNGTSTSLTKYNTSSSFGQVVDNKTVLEKADDAANAALGGNFCMPSIDEWMILCVICTWTRSSRGGHSGYEVTSPSTGNTIFLPASGYGYHTSLIGFGYYGDYWSSSFDTTFPSDAYLLSFSDSKPNKKSYIRCKGHAVRPVSY